MHTYIKIEIIMWAVNIGWNDSRKLAPVLLVIGVILDVNQAFSIAVPKVGRMWWTILNLWKQ